jgi:hypothetical protein
MTKRRAKLLVTITIYSCSSGTSPSYWRDTQRGTQFGLAPKKLKTEGGRRVNLWHM